MTSRLLLLAAAALLSLPAAAVEFIFVYPEVTANDNIGFDDPTPKATSDITGLPTTFGADRRACFEAAAAVWASHLNITVPVVVEATFGQLGGTPTSAILGHAGPVAVDADFSGAPVANTWYPIALANQLHGSDLAPPSPPTDPIAPDITAEFNSDVDNATVLGAISWYYGTDGDPPLNGIDFYSTAMHELGHGLGFLTLVGQTGQLASGVADIFARKLQDTSKTPSDFVAMSIAQRIAAIIGNNLTWKGTQVVASEGGPVRMYAPLSFAAGSSTSHWDTSLTPNQLMEPIATDPFTDIGLEKQAFEDMGWPLDVVAEGEGEGTPDPATVSIQVSGTSFLEEGDPFTLTASVSNGTATGYLWRRGATNLGSETNPTLVRNSAVQADSGTYRVQITTAAKATITSEPVSITVVPVGGLPVGGGVGLAAVAAACALGGSIGLRKRK